MTKLTAGYISGNVYYTSDKNLSSSHFLSKVILKEHIQNYNFICYHLQFWK